MRDIEYRMRRCTGCCVADIGRRGPLTTTLSAYSGTSALRSLHVARSSPLSCAVDGREVLVRRWPKVRIEIDWENAELKVSSSGAVVTMRRSPPPARPGVQPCHIPLQQALGQTIAKQICGLGHARDNGCSRRAS
jgi:hypothetical protein